MDPTISDARQDIPRDPYKCSSGDTMIQSSGAIRSAGFSSYRLVPEMCPNRTSHTTGRSELTVPLPFTVDLNANIMIMKSVDESPAWQQV